MKLGTDYILDALVDEGLGHLFMVPGGLVDPFLPALARQPKLTPIVAAHEGGAVYMADGYARARGGFGAALGIGGPGACNMATAVAAAKTDGSPLLVLTGEVPVDMEGRGAFQDASQATLDDTAVMGPLTRLSKTVADSRNLNHWFRHALTIMWAQPRGPVHLSLTHDALTGECAVDYAEVAGFFADARTLSLPQAEAALGLLAEPAGGTCRIAILAGAGIEHDAAAARLAEIAERWSIPVATTLRAKGVLPEDHALSLGVFGYGGTRHATKAILGGALDCLLVLGSGFNERDTMHWTVRERSKARMIHVNTDMDELTANSDPAHVVPGSCHAFLDLMHARAAGIAPALQAGEAKRATSRGSDAVLFRRGCWRCGTWPEVSHSTARHHWPHDATLDRRPGPSRSALKYAALRVLDPLIRWMWFSVGIGITSRLTVRGRRTGREAGAARSSACRA